MSTFEPAGLGTPHNYEDLSNKDLRKNAYTKAELRQTNFSGSDLSGVSLFGALAKGANFKGATLRATDLESCDLEDADFTNAVLEGAQVTCCMYIRLTAHTQARLPICLALHCDLDTDSAIM